MWGKKRRGKSFCDGKNKAVAMGVCFAEMVGGGEKADRDCFLVFFPIACFFFFG